MVDTPTSSGGADRANSDAVAIAAAAMTRTKSQGVLHHAQGFAKIVAWPCAAARRVATVSKTERSSLHESSSSWSWAQEHLMLEQALLDTLKLASEL